MASLATLTASEPASREGRARGAALDAFLDLERARRRGCDRDELLRLAARQICELVGVSRCSVYLRDEANGLFRGQLGYADQDIDSLVKRLVAGVEADLFTREILRTRAPVVLGDARRDGRAVRSTMRDWGVRSMLGVPLVLHGEVIGLFFLDSEERAREFGRGERELAAAFAELAAIALHHGDAVAELRESRDELLRRNRLLTEASELDRRFLELVDRGAGLDAILAAVEELTGKPASLVGGTATGREPALEALAATVEPGAVAVLGPVPFAGERQRLLAAPVCAGGERWGTLVLGERSPFGYRDRLVCRRAALAAGLAAGVDRRLAAAHWDARTALAGELLRGGEEIELRRRAAFFGLRLDEPHALCVFARRGNERQVSLSSPAVAAAMAKAGAGAELLSAEIEAGVATIVNLPAGPSQRAAVARLEELAAAACHELRPTGAVVAVISGVCRAVGDYPRALAEARELFACLDNFRPPGTSAVLSADRLGPGRLLLAGADGKQFDRFVTDALGPLLAEDAPPELLATLVGFCDNGLNVRRSAQALAVHENTVRYRLDRIAQLTGLDLIADHDSQLTVQVALLGARLRGTLLDAEGLAT